MPTITLMRHAKAELAGVGMKDFDRALSLAGRNEAATTVNLLKMTGFAPTLVFCSPARRTLETLACVRTIIPLDDSSIFNPPELYSGEVAAYQNLIRSVSSTDICLFIGHNPMIERFAFDLSTNGEKTALNHLKLGVPTAAIAVIILAEGFSAAEPQGHLQHFFTP
jgi:phosphohistidine phosphatase